MFLGAEEVPAGPPLLPTLVAATLLRCADNAGVCFQREEEDAKVESVPIATTREGAGEIFYTIFPSSLPSWRIEKVEL